MYILLNPLTPNSARSKIDKLSKITNLVKLNNKQHHSNGNLYSAFSIFKYSNALYK